MTTTREAALLIPFIHSFTESFIRLSGKSRGYVEGCESKDLVEETARHSGRSTPHLLSASLLRDQTSRTAEGWCRRLWRLGRSSDGAAISSEHAVQGRYTHRSQSYAAILRCCHVAWMFGRRTTTHCVLRRDPVYRNYLPYKNELVDIYEQCCKLTPRYLELSCYGVWKFCSAFSVVFFFFSIDRAIEICM